MPLWPPSGGLFGRGQFASKLEQGLGLHPSACRTVGPALTRARAAIAKVYPPNRMHAHSEIFVLTYVLSRGTLRVSSRAVRCRCRPALSSGPRLVTGRSMLPSLLRLRDRRSAPSDKISRGLVRLATWAVGALPMHRRVLVQLLSSGSSQPPRKGADPSPHKRAYVSTACHSVGCAERISASRKPCGMLRSGRHFEPKLCRPRPRRALKQRDPEITSPGMLVPAAGWKCMYRKIGECIAAEVRAACQSFGSVPRLRTFSSAPVRPSRHRPSTSDVGTS